MKIHKKIGLGLFLTLALAIAGVVIANPGKALAESFCSDGTWTNATYAMNDKAHIIISFKQDTCNSTHSSVKFTDSVPADTIYNYTVDPNDPSAGDVCSGSIDLNGTSPFDQRPNIKATVNKLNYFHSETGGPCPSLAKELNGASISIVNNLGAGGAPTDTGTTTITYSGQTYNQIDQGANANVYGITTDVSDCYGKSLLVLDKVNSGANSPVKGTLLTLKTFASGSSENIRTYLPNLPQGFPMSSQVGGCGYDDRGSDSVVTVNGLGVATFDSCPTWDPDCQAPATGSNPSTTTPTAQGADEACFNSGWQLSWLACPVITAAQTTANGMYGFVEDQLKFRVPEDIGGPKGEAENAWSNLRVLVSGLVVILMLVMVISQAIGGGPFDAYTIKKMLPKLVIGVIIIQLSWPIFSWVINIVNDIGVGLADILYAPFGGSDALNLNSVMGPFVTEGAVFSWVGIPALVVFGVVAPFIVLGLILSVLVAIFMGFLALLFRKILIILCLILAPLALIAWVIPGTDRYWKMWRDNFIKSLMMFPLVIAIIAAGRIFAKVGSGQGGDFVGFFIVLIGFFGPLFILPKTFKWGGTAMAAAGNGLTKFQAATLKKPKEFLGERQKGLSAERTRQSQERFSKNEEFNWRRPWRRPVDLVKSGRVDPTLWGRRRQQAMDTYVQSGEESYQKDVNAAEARIIRERQEHRARGGDHDLLLQAIAGGLTEYNDPNLGRIELGNRSPMERTAARKQLAKLGAGMNWRYLENYYQSTTDDTSAGSDERRAEMRKFFDDNVELIIPKLPHIYKSIHQAADADPGTIANMHGVEVEAIFSNLSAIINNPASSDADRERAQNSLTTFLQNLQRAVESSQHGGPQLENGILRATKGFLERDETIARPVLNDINFEERHGRRATTRGTFMPGEGPRVLHELVRSQDVAFDAEHAPAIEALRGSLGGAIHQSGYVQGTPGAGRTRDDLGDETEIDIEHDETPPAP